MIGRIWLRARQQWERWRYHLLLRNGSEVLRQNTQSDQGDHTSLLTELQFRNGPTFRVRDGLTAAHTTREIFLEDIYHLPNYSTATVIVDIGANIGLFSYLASQRSPRAQLHLFEADAETLPILQENLSRIGCDRLKLNPLAVTATDGEIDFYVASLSGWSSLYPTLGAAEGRKIRVPCTRLSTYIAQHQLPHIDILKIDIEGGEYAVLLDDPDLWKTPIHSLIAEVDRRPRDAHDRHSYDQLIAELKKHFSCVEERQGGDYPLIACTRRHCTSSTPAQ